MRIRKRYQALIEDGPSRIPGFAWIVFAVCAVGDDACGWAGWIVDELCAGVPHEDASVSGCELLPADYSEKCPQCGKQLFRTAFERRLEASPDQTPVFREGVNFVGSGGIEYY
jgi:hypothetical protein